MKLLVNEGSFRVSKKKKNKVMTHVVYCARTGKEVDQGGCGARVLQ